MSLRSIPNDVLDLYALECSQGEESILTDLASDSFVRVREALKDMFAFERDVAPIRIIAIGSDVTPERLKKVRSQGLLSLLNYPFPGSWWRDFRVGLASFEQNAFIERTILHEFVHGMISAVSEEFQYPYVLEEGFAVAACESMFFQSPDWPSGAWVTGAVSAPPTRKDPEQLMTVSELLRFRIAGLTGTSARVCELSLFLHRFIMLLSRGHPSLRQVLVEAKTQNLCTGAEVHDWICQNANMNCAELEASFLSFCTDNAYRIQ